MNETQDLHAALRGVLDAVEDAPPIEAVEAATRELGAILGALSVSFLIADLSGRALVRMSHGERPRSDDAEGSRRDQQEVAVSVPLHDGAAGRAMSTQAVQVLPPAAPGDAGPAEAGGQHAASGWTVLAPVTERGEALGLLELVLPDEPSEATVAEIARTAHLLGFALVASRRHTDVFEWAQRSTPYSLAAEIQRRLLPAGFTCEGGSFTLSAWLEPSQDVGGDTYDYSLARDVLHLSLTDAMGHGVASSLTATLSVGSLRNSRRYGHSLREQATAANEALCSHRATVAVEGFCTGILGRLDLRTGSLELVNAGHVAPYLLRDGAVQEIQLAPDLPFGLYDDTVYGTSDLALHPGDRLVLVTDGMLERNATDLDLPASIEATASLHPRDATRALADLVLDATDHTLADDATLLILDWHGHHGDGRDTRAGTAL